MGNRRHTVDVDLIARKRVDRDEQGMKGRQTISEFDSTDSIDDDDLFLLETTSGDYKKAAKSLFISQKNIDDIITENHREKDNYVLSSGVYADALIPAASSWTTNSGTPPIDETTIVRKAGNSALRAYASSSIQYTMTGEDYYNASPSNTTPDGTPGSPANYTDFINLSIYCDDPNTSAQITTWISSNDGSPTLAGRRRVILGGSDTGVLMHGWTDFTIPLSAFTNDGNQTIDWNNIRSIRFDPTANINTWCVIDNVYFTREVTPSVVFVLDDGDQSQYDHRFEFINRGIPISWAVARSVINTTALFDADLDEAMADGFGEIILHGADKYSTLAAADTDTLRTEIDAAIEWNKTRGYKYDIGAYPNGTAYGPSPADTQANHDLDQTVIGILKTRGMRSFRAINMHGGTVIDGHGVAYVSHSHGLARPFEINSQAITSVGGASPDVDDIIAGIDYAISNNVSIVFNLHAIVDSLPTGNETTLTDLITILDYVNIKKTSGSLQVLTYSDFINNLDMTGGLLS